MPHNEEPLNEETHNKRPQHDGPQLEKRQQSTENPSGTTGLADDYDGAPPTGPAGVYGAAPERTTLAWQRTGLGVVVCSFLIFHTAFQLGVLGVSVLAAGLGLGIAALSVFSFPAERYRRGLPADSWRLLCAVTVSVVCLGSLGAITGVLSLFS